MQACSACACKAWVPSLGHDCKSWWQNDRAPAHRGRRSLGCPRQHHPTHHAVSGAVQASTHLASRQHPPGRRVRSRLRPPAPVRPAPPRQGSGWRMKRPAAQRPPAACDEVQGVLWVLSVSKWGRTPPAGSAQVCHLVILLPPFRLHDRRARPTCLGATINTPCLVLP